MQIKLELNKVEWRYTVYPHVARVENCLSDLHTLFKFNNSSAEGKSLKGGYGARRTDSGINRDFDYTEEISEYITAYNQTYYRRTF